MHTKDSIAEGEDIQRLFLVSAWRESPQFSEREKIALGWCEAITLISQCDPDDDLYSRVLQEFGAEETVALTGSIIAINAWNRLNVAFRAIPGTYRVHTGDPTKAQRVNREEKAIWCVKGIEPEPIL